MAMSSVIKKASSTVIPLPIRAIASSRILSGSITNAFNSADKIERPFKFSHNFSTDGKKQVDRKLVKVLKSEIKWAKLLETSMPPTPPHDFPFTIHDTPGVKDLHLKREFGGEEISILIHPPNIPEEDDSDQESDTSDDDSNDNDNGCSRGPPKDLMLDLEIVKSVVVSTKISTKMKFRVSVFADHIIIHTMELEEEPNGYFQHYGPYGPFVGQEWEIPYLRGVLRRYIEVRGITVTKAEFMYKYAIWKAKRERVLALEQVRKFLKE